MKMPRTIVLIPALLMFAAWLGANYQTIIADPDGLIRFVLGFVFFLLILFRWKKDVVNGVHSGPVVPITAVIGALLCVGGIIFVVKQAEWLGLIFLLYACLRWALPSKFGTDVMLALFILYWVHPLPGTVLGDVQAWMQTLSVKGSEMVLQGLNQRVWADGSVLQTGFRAFDVDLACSGLRTSVTVLICVIGVGILFYLRWFEIVIFAFLGMLQVLVLNITRISLLVYWSARKPPEWGGTILHDTMGIFLLAAILLVQLEISWWKVYSVRRARLRQAVESGEAESPDRATMLPRFWLILLKWGWLMALVALLVAGSIVGVLRLRPGHRAAMLEGVVEGLIVRDLDAAERALAYGQRLSPGNRTLKSRRVQLLVMRGRNGEALDALSQMSKPLLVFESIMQSWALMGLGRVDEAAAVVDALPGPVRDHPLVAVIRAEFAARENKPEVVGRYVIVAAKSHLAVNRARKLFPYLAQHQQWAAIAKSDNPHVAFDDFAAALIAVHASLEIYDVGSAADIMKRVLRLWPNDPRLLSGLYQIASNRPGTEWEDIFERIFVHNVATLDADRLASCINYAFEMNRPELAWMAYVGLAKRDPADPALFMAPVRFADIWFTFRKQRLGIESDSRFENVDMRSFIAGIRDLPPFNTLWDRVPLADEILTGNLQQLRTRYLDKCIDTIQRRQKAGTTVDRMEMMYPSALAMAGRYNEAHAELDSLAKEHPGKRDAILYEHAMYYDQQGKWQEGYESMRQFYAENHVPNMILDMMMVKALMNINLGVCAMDVAERSKANFPDSARLDDIIAAIWNTFGYKEQALFVLSRNRSAANPKTVAELLYDTGRFQEADKAARAIVARDSIGVRQADAGWLAPMPAEAVLEKRWPRRTDAELDSEAEKFEAQAKSATSPFVKSLYGLNAEWCRARGKGAVSDPARWRAAGRDPLEKAAALNWLSTLLACRQEYVKAREPATQAVELLPRSAILWRSLIDLNDGDDKVIAKAIQACPRDPEIWLASLVSRTRKEGPGEWAIDEVRAGADRFPAETIISAGDYFLRQGMLEAAAEAAREGIARGGGLASAHVLGLTCALLQKDMSWAETCILAGADLVKDPTPFYKVLVDVKSLGNGKDSDVLAALEYLQENMRGESKWSERLGEAYFMRGDTKRAFSVLTPVIEKDIERVGGQSLILAAEAARIDGRNRAAVKILEAAYKMYPDKVSVANNLVYTLAQEAQTLPRARELVPMLLKMAPDNPNVLDTIATVYLKSGQLAKAGEYSDKATKRQEEAGVATAEIALTAAEVMFLKGDYDGAREKVEAVRRAPELSPMVDAQSRELLSEVERALKDRL